MTTQTLMTKDEVAVLSGSTATSSVETPQVPADPRQSRLLEAMKAQYRLDQQEKFLHLQAETESLLQQLKALKEQRLAVQTR